MIWAKLVVSRARPTRRHDMVVHVKQAIHYVW
jgi:hypothetical protein